MQEIVCKKDAEGNWTWESKVEVASLLIIHGNVRAVSRMTSVPHDTILSWRRSDWWDNLTAEIKRDMDIELQGKLSTVVEKALHKVQDRLENGDYILNNKTGEIMRKEVSMKDAAKVLTDVLNTKVKLEKQTEVQPVSKQSVPDLLKTLATEFAKFNKQQQKQTAETIEFVERT